MKQEDFQPPLSRFDSLVMNIREAAKYNFLLVLLTGRLLMNGSTKERLKRRLKYRNASELGIIHAFVVDTDGEGKLQLPQSWRVLTRLMSVRAASTKAP